MLRLLPLLYEGLSASLWKDERVSHPYSASSPPPFRLTSDKRPEGSQRRFHESYWQGRKTERRDVVGEWALRTRLYSIVLHQQPVRRPFFERRFFPCLSRSKYPSVYRSLSHIPPEFLPCEKNFRLLLSKWIID